MKVLQDGLFPEIDMGDWKIQLEETRDGYLNLRMVDKNLSSMKVVPHSGNVIRIKPEQR